MDKTSVLRQNGRMGIPDVFSEHYGNQNQLLDYFGLSVNKIVETAKKGMEQ